MTTTAADLPTTDSVGARRGAPAGPKAVVGVRRRRRQQIPWIALGVLIIVMSMLGFALWSLNEATRTPVLVAGRDIGAGETIEASDLVLVSVGADAGLAVLQSGEEDLVVGRVARGPVPVGTPLSQALVIGPSEAVPEGQAVVGAVLEPGQYPSAAMRAGDRVQVVRTGSALSADEGGPADIGQAMIWAVEPLAEGRRELFVSLLVDVAAAETTADVAAANRMRLVLLGDG